MPILGRPTCPSGTVMNARGTCVDAPRTTGISFGDVLRAGGGIIKRAIPGGLDDALLDALIPGGGGGKNFGPAIPKVLPCPPGSFRASDGSCTFVRNGGSSDPTPTTQTPAERSMGAGGGIQAPSASAVTVHKCPRFGDGKTGVLYMHAITGELACLPRGTSQATAKKMLFIRKNKPRPKPKVSAAKWKLLKEAERLKETTKDMAMDAGWKVTRR